MLKLGVGYEYNHKIFGQGKVVAISDGEPNIVTFKILLKGKAKHFQQGEEGFIKSLVAETPAKPPKRRKRI